MLSQYPTHGNECVHSESYLCSLFNCGRAQQRETKVEGVAPEYEAIQKQSVNYEEVKDHYVRRDLPHPPNGDYELTECPAYGPVV